jgi:hypothetical protein
MMNEAMHNLAMEEGNHGDAETRRGGEGESALAIGERSLSDGGAVEETADNADGGDDGSDQATGDDWIGGGAQGSPQTTVPTLLGQDSSLGASNDGGTGPVPVPATEVQLKRRVQVLVCDDGMRVLGRVKLFEVTTCEGDEGLVRGAMLAAGEFLRGRAELRERGD